MRRVLVVLSAAALCCGRDVTPVRLPADTTAPPPASAPGTSSPANEATSDDDARKPVEVIHDYYDAIAAHDYKRAYGLWGSSGPPGQSMEKFAAGFADTASVRVETGTPSQVGAAAGSRYIEVPVTIVAKTKSGVEQRFAGTYTLRRAVVDGASASERSWHLYRAALRPM